MRNRASSIQSAPGGIQPPVPAARTHTIHQNHGNNTTPTTFEPDEISMNIQKFGSHTHADRAASTEHFLSEPTAPQRAMRAASAAPAINVISPSASSASSAAAAAQTPPPRHHHKVNLMKTNSIDVIQPAVSTTATTSTKTNPRSKHDDKSVLNHQFGAMNLSSSSTSFFNSTTNSSSLDTSLRANTTLNTSEGSSATTNTSKEVKRKKRWNILRRSKTPDKQKSATLGREKTTKTQMTKVQLAQDDLNLPHRWSTGVPKLQPIPGVFSKDKLVMLSSFFHYYFKLFIILFTVSNTQ